MDDFGREFQPLADRFGLNWELRTSQRKARVGILVSRQGHCLYDLLGRWRLGEFRAEFPIIISNHLDHESVARAFDIEFLHLPISPDTKSDQEAQMLEALTGRGIDLVILARYMQILSAEFLGHFENRVINIHHSFLPAFAGDRPYQQAHERGVKIIGATAHYATAELDQGPIIEQDVVRISHRDSVRDLVAKGRDLEKVVLARAIDFHLRHRILVYGNKTVVFD